MPCRKSLLNWPPALLIPQGAAVGVSFSIMWYHQIFRKRGAATGAACHDGRRRLGLPAGALLALCVLSGPAQAAWDFIPTPLEWESWPLYCRVQYSWVNNGFEFQYGGRYSAEVVENWLKTVGKETFIGLHHYCASIHFLNRARGEPEPNMHRFELERAWTDVMYSFVRADPSSMVYPNMAVTAAQVRLEMGKPDESEEILQRGIDAQPRRPDAYVMMALLYRKQPPPGCKESPLDCKRSGLQRARDVLAKANEVTAGQSAEVQYNLGLLEFELGDMDAASESAKKAYALGYPLPGLKNKLTRIGRWHEAEAPATP